MAQEPGIIIRKFEVKDTQAIKQIAYDTALMGEPASLFFEGREVMADALTLYYTDYEPESCFVAEVNAQVAGYLTGAKNKVLAEKIFNEKIAGKLLCRALSSGIFLKKKNIIFLLRCLGDIARGRLIAPDFTQEYPATLHINVSKGYRGQDIGAGLIDKYLDYLKSERVCGVHLATMSESAGKFFSSQRFNLLHASKRSYFRHILHKDIPLYIFGKKLRF